MENKESMESMENKEGMDTDQFIIKIRNITFICAAIYLVVGIFLAATPTVMNSILGFILGFLGLGLGIYRLYSYYKNQLTESVLATDLFAGVLLAVLGFVCLVFHDKALIYYPVIFGIFLIFGGVMKMQTSIILRGLGHQMWWLTLIMGLVSIVMSVFMIMKPSFLEGAFLVVAGAFMIYDGGSCLAAVIIEEKYQREMKKGLYGWGHPAPKMPETDTLNAAAGIAPNAAGVAGSGQPNAGNPAYAAGAAAAGYTAAGAGMTGVPAPEAKKEKKKWFESFKNLFKKKEKTEGTIPAAGENMETQVAGAAAGQAAAPAAEYAPLNTDPFSSNPSHDASMPGVSFDAVKDNAAEPVTETVTEQVMQPAEEPAAEADPLPELKPDEIQEDVLKDVPVDRFDPETGKPLS